MTALRVGRHREVAEHVDYPHDPGYLYDCPACDDGCFCSPGSSQCVYDGPHATNCLDWS